MMIVRIAERGTAMIENPDKLHWSNQEADDFLLAFEQLARDLIEISEGGMDHGNRKCDTGTKATACP